MYSNKKSFIQLGLLSGFAILISACASHDQGDVSFKRHRLTLESGNVPTVFEIHNTGRQAVLVDFAKHPDSAKAGLASEIKPGKYSALWLDQGELRLACYDNHQMPLKRIDCGNNLDVKIVLQPATTHSSGEYWVAENLTYPQMCTKMAQRGVKSSCQKS